MVYKVPFKLSHYPSHVHVYKTKKRTLIIPTLLGGKRKLPERVMLALMMS